MFKKLIILFVVLLILMQFYRPRRNVSAAPMPADISQVYAVPADVEAILKKACNDCHSNNTIYPWYAEIQPVRWWLDSHVNEGKEELNFNEFKNYRPGKQYHKLEEVVEMIKEDEMPLSSYTLIHTEAKLSKAEKDILIGWANAIRDTMKAVYPIDSLERKRPQQQAE